MSEQEETTGLVFKEFLSKASFNGKSFLFVFHLSKNNVFYLEEWVQRFETIGVISIPYSEQSEVKERVEKYVPVYSPSLENIPNEIERICAEHENKSIVLVEIGGYSASIMDRIPNVALIVEDTLRGHKNFEEYRADIHCPIVSIARTDLKNIENKKVGAAIAEASLRLCENADASRDTILVLSYGNIGRHVAAGLQELGVEPLIYDTHESRCTEATDAGFRVVERETALGKADVIIGCTGERSLSIKDISLLKDGCLLISGSSRQIEFPYQELLAYVTAAEIDNPIEKISYFGKELYIAYRGQPINFYYDMPLGPIFEVPMVGLIQSVTYGLSGIPSGLYDLPPAEQRAVLDTFPSSLLNQ